MNNKEASERLIRLLKEKVIPGEDIVAVGTAVAELSRSEQIKESELIYNGGHIKCPKCGYEIQRRFYYCPICGREIIWNTRWMMENENKKVIEYPDYIMNFFNDLNLSAGSNKYNIAIMSKRQIFEELCSYYFGGNTCSKIRKWIKDIWGIELGD